MSNVFCNLLLLIKCVFLIQVSLSQKLTIKGFVTDKKSAPIVGISINVEGAKGIIAITRLLDIFTPTVPPDAKRLLIS